MRRLTLNVAIIWFSIMLLLGSVQVASAQAGQEWTDTVCTGGYFSESAADVATIQGIECLLGNIFIVFLAMMGFAAFIMIVVGAMKILLPGGNTKNVESGKNTITYAIIGIILALCGFIIINLLSSFVGVNLLNLKIPRATFEMDAEDIPQE